MVTCKVIEILGPAGRGGRMLAAGCSPGAAARASEGVCPVAVTALPTVASGPASKWGAQWRVLTLLVRRDLRLRYAGAWLGYVWTVLDPLLMALVYAFVFGTLMGARRIGEQPYVLYLIVGVLSWNWFTTAVTDGCRSLTAEAKIVRSSNVPREIWAARTVASKMLEFVFALPVILGFALYYGHGVGMRIVFFPVAMVLQFLMCFGIALILAPLTVIANDVQRVVKILLRMGFYFTPVLYSINSIVRGREWLRVLAELNPMAGVMSLYRMGFWSHDTLTWRAYTVSVGFTVFVLALGLWVFRRLEGTVLKEI
jgi:ABC-2 type transport system permease protein